MQSQTLPGSPQFIATLAGEWNGLSEGIDQILNTLDAQVGAVIPEKWDSLAAYEFLAWWKQVTSDLLLTAQTFYAISGNLMALASRLDNAYIPYNNAAFELEMNWPGAYLDWQFMSGHYYPCMIVHPFGVSVPDEDQTRLVTQADQSIDLLIEAWAVSGSPSGDFVNQHDAIAGLSQASIPQMYTAVASDANPFDPLAWLGPVNTFQGTTAQTFLQNGAPPPQQSTPSDSWLSNVVHVIEGFSGAVAFFGSFATPKGFVIETAKGVYWTFTHLQDGTWSSEPVSGTDDTSALDKACALAGVSPQDMTETDQEQLLAQLGASDYSNPENVTGS